MGSNENVVNNEIGTQMNEMVNIIFTNFETELKFVVDVGYYVPSKIRPKFVSFDNSKSYISLINFIMLNLEKNMFSTKQMILNSNIMEFRDYDYLRWLIRNICITLGVYESDLNIIEKPKGGMMGDLLYFYDDSVYNLNDYNSIQPIPEKVSLVEFVETKADFILVVESYVVFRELVFNNNIRKRFNLIIVSNCDLHICKGIH